MLRGFGASVIVEVRSHRVEWLAARFYCQSETLPSTVNRETESFLGLSTCECHYAVYDSRNTRLAVLGTPEENKISLDD